MGEKITPNTRIRAGRWRVLLSRPGTHGCQCAKFRRHCGSEEAVHPYDQLLRYHLYLLRIEHSADFASPLSEIC